MDFWVNADGEVVVDGSGNPIDCGSCPCSEVCCGDIHFGYVARIVFDWGPEVNNEQLNLIYNSSTGKWEGTDFCGSQLYQLNMYCHDDQWFFDLITGGVNYALPIANEPGGATLQSCDPFHVYGEITSGYYADDFPFCDKSGTFPTGDFLRSFRFDATES